MPSVLQELQNWYFSQCDGDWEHCFGIEIGNIDNPGWTVCIELAETSLEDAPFRELQENYGELDWMICQKSGTQFVANGGPHKLEAMLKDPLSELNITEIIGRSCDGKTGLSSTEERPVS